MGAPDPTLDLSSGAVGSFRLDNHTESLKQRLGPPGNLKRWRELDEWFYPHFGVRFEGGNGLIVGINLVVRREVEYHPTWGKLWRQGAGPIRFSDGLKISALDVCMGYFEEYVRKPDEHEEGDAEIVWTYCDTRKSRGFSFDAEFTPEAELTDLLLSSSS